MGMFSASQQKSDANRALITKVFQDKVSNAGDYKIAYGFGMKGGLFSKKMFNYVVGFNPASKKILLIQITSDGEVVSDVMTFNKENNTSVKKTMQGGWRIQSSVNEKPVEIMVPGFLPDSVEDTYQLPINQNEIATDFLNMMKNY
jgi:hypothetical protein